MHITNMTEVSVESDYAKPHSLAPPAAEDLGVCSFPHDDAVSALVFSLVLGVG